jgi:hypothetical protein
MRLSTSRSVATTTKNCPALVIALLLALAGIAPMLHAADSAYDIATKPQKATVSILALCTSVRSSLNSQDVYLAYVSMPHDERRLARLVDAYPGYEKPIRASLLKQQRQFRMILIRDPESDVAYSNLYVPQDPRSHFAAVPADALAALDEGRLQTFTVIHSRTKLAPTTSDDSTANTAHSSR